MTPAPGVGRPGGAGIGRDAELHPVEVDEQPEQVQVERPEHQVERGASLSLRRRRGGLGRTGERRKSSRHQDGEE